MNKNITFEEFISQFDCLCCGDTLGSNESEFAVINIVNPDDPENENDWIVHGMICSFCCCEHKQLDSDLEALLIHGLANIKIFSK